MCTVTTIPLPAGGFRVAFNRDESRARPAALPPLLSWAGDVRSMMPIDPLAGGTWIAATDRGITFALLNYNLTRAPRRQTPRRQIPPASRGTIIPFLAECRDLLDVYARVASLRANRFDPFRLLVIASGGVVEFVSDATAIARRALPHDIGRPLLFTSSGLGDERVEQPRRALFEATIGPEPTAERQDMFHRHRWPDRPHLSVCMSRSEARTISYTTVEVQPTCATMRYWPMSPDEAADVSATVRRIPLISHNGLLRPAGCA
jgi:hypothetical protein